MPIATKWPFLAHAGVLAFAHRGGAVDYPENTMAAFQHSVDLGYRYLETDVHRSADGVLVAFHDDVLDRVTDKQGAIADMAWADIQQARIDGTHRIPRLAELFSSFPDAYINIDPKEDDTVEPLIDEIVAHDAIDRVCVGSFEQHRLERLREALGPGLCSSTSPRETAAIAGRGFRLPVPLPAVGCAQVPVEHKGVTVVTERFVGAAHRAGIQVHVWTIDEPAEMQRLLDLGVDGLMTDRPKVLKATLEARGDWAE